MSELLIAMALFCQTPNGAGAGWAVEAMNKQVKCRKQLAACVLKKTEHKTSKFTWQTVLVCVRDGV